MRVNIVSDATFHAIRKVGAYAFWIICDQGQIRRAGPLKEVENSASAYWQAQAEALTALRDSKFAGIELIAVFCASEICDTIYLASAREGPATTCRHLIKELLEKHSGARLKFAEVDAKMRIPADWCADTVRELVKGNNPPNI